MNTCRVCRGRENAANVCDGLCASCEHRWLLCVARLMSGEGQAVQDLAESAHAAARAQYVIRKWGEDRARSGRTSAPDRQ